MNMSKQLEDYLDTENKEHIHLMPEKSQWAK